MGRINHNLSGEQAGADLERLKLAKEKFQLVYVEMEPGDALFFHCNLLHSRYMWIVNFVLYKIRDIYIKEQIEVLTHYE